MRKNLHYKVLASVLAIAGLYFYNAPAAWADNFKLVENTPNTWIGNGEINENNQIPDTASVYGWYSQYPDYGNNADNNKITINNSTLAQVYGAYTSIDKDSANSSANSNVVTINNSNIRDVCGGYSEHGTASGNEVLIKDDNNDDNNSFYKVIGGSTSSGSATGNTVTISGNVTLTGSSNVSYIAGGQGASGSTVSDNHVIIEGGTVSGNIYGGYGTLYADGTTISGNKITVENSANIADADLYGGYANSSTATINNNTLTLDGWSGSVNSVNNFSDIYINNFTLNKNLIDVGSVSGMDGVKIHLGAFTSAIALNADDYAVGDDIVAATIEWDEKLGSKVDFTIKDEDDKPIEAFAGSLANQTINNTFYIDDRTEGGIYATKL